MNGDDARLDLSDYPRKQWSPNDEERKYIELIMSMCVDCLSSRGTENRRTFISNLKDIAYYMERKQ